MLAKTTAVAVMLVAALALNGDAAAHDGKAAADAGATAQPSAAGEPALPPGAPKDGTEAVDAAKKVIEMGKAKQWFGMSAGIIGLLMFLFKRARKSIGFMQRVPKRVLWILVPVLSVAAMVLAKLQADLSWGAALTVLFSGPSVAFLNDLIKRGIAGKEPSTSVNSGA